MRTPSCLQKLSDEDGDDAGFAVGILARPVNVAVAQRGEVQILGGAIKAQIMFGDHFRDAVRRARPLRRRVVNGKSIRRAEAGAARGEDHLPRAAALRVLEHVEQADDVDLRVVDRVARRDRDRMLGGVVAHDVGLELREDASEAFVAHVHVHQRDAAGYVDAPAAAVLPERVDDQNLVPRREVGVGDVRSDESGAAGDDDADDASSCSS